MTQDEKRCFVISPIGETGSETRKRSDQVLKHVVRPAVSQCGYNAVRADEIDTPGLITSQVIQHVVDDPLVVADLTDRNPNVFYELAIRHALRRPLVQLIRDGEAIPFDVAGTRTILVDHQDLDSVENAKSEIVRQIKILEEDSSDIETPISVSLDLQLLRQSTNPEERSLADLVAAVGEVRQSLGEVDAQIKRTDHRRASEGNRLEVLLERFFEDRQMPRLNRHRYDPSMFLEILHISPQSRVGFPFLIAASYFRDSLPWLYEMGVEVYRLATHGPKAKLRKAAREFKEAFEFAVDGPMSSRLFAQRRESRMIIEEIGPFLNRALEAINQ